MRKLLTIVILALVGCDTPGPEFEGIAPTRIAIGPSWFDVRVRGARAEAIRLNTDFATRFDEVAPRGVWAIEKVSGCRVRRLEGDAAVMQAWLDCGGRLPPLPQERSYECSVDVVYESFADLTCEPA